MLAWTANSINTNTCDVEFSRDANTIALLTEILVDIVGLYTFVEEYS